MYKRKKTYRKILFGTSEPILNRLVFWGVGVKSNLILTLKVTTQVILIYYYPMLTMYQIWTHLNVLKRTEETQNPEFSHWLFFAPVVRVGIRYVPIFFTPGSWGEKIMFHSNFILTRRTQHWLSYSFTCQFKPLIEKLYRL